MISRFAAPFLVLITVVCFAGTLNNDFVSFDDDRYLTHNEFAQAGLTGKGIWYALTTTATGNWIPLTWLSLELDVSLFGLNAPAHHAVNLLFHCANVVLFFHLIQACGGSLGRSFFAAALFALHPLHVESVAWISERKDVLSTLFLLLCCLAYVKYVRVPTRQHFVIVMIWLALGLLAKPMLVTLPVLFLIADLWPLNRVEKLTEEGLLSRSVRRSLFSLCLEKVPLLIVVAVMSGVTMFAQNTDQAFVNWQAHPFTARVANVICGYVWYLTKTVAPTGLCIFYPLNYGSIDWALTSWSLAILLLITGFVIFQFKDRPYLLFGWAWFVISLFPVSGILQVGGQAHADRFSYVPHLGLFVAITWLIADLTSRFSFSRQLQWGLSTCVLMVCGLLTMDQVAVWKDSQTLWTHANSVTEQNWMARFHLGLEQMRLGNREGARDYARQSLDIRPHHADALSLIGNTFVQEERWDYAQMSFTQALELDPRHRTSLVGMAAVCHARGELRRSEQYLLHALSQRPGDVYVRNQLGMIYAVTGRQNEALTVFKGVISDCDWNGEAWRSAGYLMSRMGHHEEALPYFQRACQLAPEDPISLNLLARTYQELGYDEEAQRTFARLRDIQQNLAREQQTIVPVTAQSLSW